MVRVVRGCGVDGAGCVSRPVPRRPVGSARLVLLSSAYYVYGQTPCIIPFRLLDYLRYIHLARGRSCAPLPFAADGARQDETQWARQRNWKDAK